MGIKRWRAAALVAALAGALLSARAMAVTFVYVSHAHDGDIGMYRLMADGSLQPGPRFKADKVVMPMTVSRDKHWLIAAVRSKPYLAYTYSIHRTSGALQLVSTGPLAESLPYIQIDRTGRWLFGASYGGNLVSVNPVGAACGGQPGHAQPGGGGRARRRAAPGDPDGAQCPRDSQRPHEPLRLRAALGDRPDLPVRVRREHRAPERQHAAARAAQGRNGATSPRALQRQPLPLPAERAHCDDHHARPRCQDRAPHRGELALIASPQYPAPAGRTAPAGRRAARSLERHLGLRPAYHARRALHLYRRAHRQHHQYA